ncbi:MAG: DPP IV N-terminal domain-containing protein [Bacteroidales bacterium]|nr:DPP IV N-terminal domain-containing protein [Bacteroidales bacterium]
MKKLFLLIALAVCSLAYAQQTPVTKANYDLAERFSAKKVAQMVFSTDVRPNWFKNSDKFWYTYKTTKGEEYYIVDPVAGTKRKIWDMGKLAAQISAITKDPFDAQHLPIQKLELVDDDKAFEFEIKTSVMVPKKQKPGEKKPAKGAKENKVFRFKWDIASGRLTDITDVEAKKDYPRWASISPDGKYAVYGKNYNLWYMDMENLKKAVENEKDSTIVEFQLTKDGSKEFPYAGRGMYGGNHEEDTTKRTGAGIVWSPDSKHFALTRSDMSKVKELWVIDVLANPRPKLEGYKYQMPGEPGPKAYLYLFDFENKNSRTINIDAFKDQSVSVLRNPVTVKERYADYVPMKWMGDNGKFYFTRQSRDQKRVDLCCVDVATGECKLVLHEELNTYVETRGVEFFNNNTEFVFWSERDGWAHLYLYGADGTLKNQITSGEYHVDQILGVDPVKRVVYFTACGKEDGINPYYMYAYSANLDGSNVRLLNKGDYDNKVNMSDDNRYFVNNYSRVDCTPKTALYDNTGRKIMDLEEADLSQLIARGYKFPEIFTVKAGDGITDLYGVMYKPFDFDSTKLYPIIEYVYPGPQTEANNSSWSKGMDRIDRLAQLGFIVVTVGNRGGHPNRSKWYHNFGYGNLRDYGLEDKKVAVQQLAARHPFINGNKVGIHGHSGGGFMSTAAILKYPDFFSAAVSCAGNHDNSIYNRWWSEQHHGVLEEVSEKGDTTFKYSINTNQQLAKNLKGNLLLVHGDIDNNVHPGNTIRVVDALIKANKRFQMLILPGQRHAFGNMTEYFFWRMADHFCEYLIGDSQKEEIDIKQMNNN